MSSTNKIYYYDTSAFWRFFTIEYVGKTELSDEIIKYSPLFTKLNLKRMISPWTIEEFFYAYISQQGKEIKKLPRKLRYPPDFFKKEIEERTEILSEIKSYVYLFSQENVDTRVVNQIFLSLIFSAKENDILSIKRNDKKIDSKDLLHLAYSLYFNTNSLITCDKGFELIKTVETIKRMLNQYKLKQIIILEDKLNSLVKRIDII